MLLLLRRNFLQTRGFSLVMGRIETVPSSDDCSSSVQQQTSAERFFFLPLLFEYYIFACTFLPIHTNIQQNSQKLDTLSRTPPTQSAVPFEGSELHSSVQARIRFHINLSFSCSSIAITNRGTGGTTPLMGEVCCYFPQQAIEAKGGKVLSHHSLLC